MAEQTNNKQQNQVGRKQPTQQQLMQSETSPLTGKVKGNPSFDELCSCDFKSEPDEVFIFIKVFCKDLGVELKEVDNKEVSLLVATVFHGTILERCINLSRFTKSIDLLFIQHPKRNQWCIYPRVSGKLGGKIENSWKLIQYIYGFLFK